MCTYVYSISKIVLIVDIRMCVCRISMIPNQVRPYVCGSMNINSIIVDLCTLCTVVVLRCDEVSPASPLIIYFLCVSYRIQKKIGDRNCSHVYLLKVPVPVPYYAVVISDLFVNKMIYIFIIHLSKFHQ